MITYPKANTNIVSPARLLSSASEVMSLIWFPLHNRDNVHKKQFKRCQLSQALEFSKRGDVLDLILTR